MRNFTIKVIEKIPFVTTRWKLKPFPGAYPTRVLVVKRSPKDWRFAECKPFNTFKDYEVLYFGKPNAIILKEIADRKGSSNFMYYEFDKKTIVYAAGVVVGRITSKTAGIFNFYHPYTAYDPFVAWPWFTSKWAPLKVGKYTAYNHFPQNGPAANVNLQLALQNELDARGMKNVYV
jgi:hypothetical protein